MPTRMKGTDATPVDWSTLFPGNERRFAAFLLRMPWQLPINNGSSFMFILDGDLGESWDLQTTMRPVVDRGEFVDAACPWPCESPHAWPREVPASFLLIS